MKRAAVLGSTGSIGVQTLDVVAMHPDRLQVVGLAAHSSHEQLREQATRFGVSRLALFDPSAAGKLGCPSGIDALVEMATAPDVDVVVVSVAGMIGLEPTLAALQAGKQVALASKEVLVAGGELVMPLAGDLPSLSLRPIDSEHSALLQCLQGERLDEVEQLVLTASGGPFRGWSRGDLEAVTAEQALAHPTWRMGGKITVDSATMMNKGLELIEACHLYGIPPDRVEIVVHPQSVIHSMVRFRDDSVMAQLGHPDMKLPIQYALLGPERIESPANRWDPAETPNLSFEPLDREVFTLPDVAREAFRRGGLCPAWVNAVNEEAANAFLRGETGFMDLIRSVEDSLGTAPSGTATLDSVLAADAEARAKYRESVARA